LQLRRERCLALHERWNTSSRTKSWQARRHPRYLTTRVSRMSPAVQLVIAVAIGLAGSVAFNASTGQPMFLPASGLAFTLATVLTVIACWLPLPPRRRRRAEKATPASLTGREQGTVKWFNVTKGFGFIVRANGEEIFVHQRQLTKSARRGLQPGQRVSYRITDSERGPQAAEVETLDHDDTATFGQAEAGQSEKFRRRRHRRRGTGQ